MGSAISGTSRPTKIQSKVFDSGVLHVVELAKKLGKKYVVGGSLLPGYARYVEKKGNIAPSDYVFKKINNKYVDPLIEKYRKLDFIVPDKNHVLADYFESYASLNYSALVVKKI